MTSNEIVPTTSTEDALSPLCGAVAAQCICDRDPHPSSAVHHCACGGEWVQDGETFRIVAWPGGSSSPFTPLFGVLS